MKIVHAILTSRFAGSERYAIELANAQSHHHDVSIILSPKASENRADALKHRVASRVTVHELKSRTKFFQIYEIRRLLSSIPHDVIHGHLSTACRALSGLTCSSARVATLHIHYKHNQHQKLDGLIAIAPWQLADIPEKLQSRTRQIDNWTSDKIAAPGMRDHIRESFGIAPGDILIGALGRVVESKGFDILIDAFRQSGIPNAKLAIIGNGKEWKMLKAKAGSDIIMPGFWPTPEDWLAAFDVFVSAARTEPFGLVFLEAMNSGLPVIATASQGALHLRNLINSALVPIDNVGAMQKALENFCKAPVQRTVYNLSNYRIESKLTQIDEFYQMTMT
jgi:glycosyltransferase involved in cell wall biosynthesis